MVEGQHLQGPRRGHQQCPLLFSSHSTTCSGCDMDGAEGGLISLSSFNLFFSFFEAKASHINCCLLVYNVCQYVVNKYEHRKNTLVTNYGPLWFFFQRSFNSNICMLWTPTFYIFHWSGVVYKAQITHFIRKKVPM